MVCHWVFWLANGSSFVNPSLSPLTNNMKVNSITDCEAVSKLVYFCKDRLGRWTGKSLYTSYMVQKQHTSTLLEISNSLCVCDSLIADLNAIQTTVLKCFYRRLIFSLSFMFHVAPIRILVLTIYILSRKNNRLVLTFWPGCIFIRANGSVKNWWYSPYTFHDLRTGSLKGKLTASA